MHTAKETEVIYSYITVNTETAESKSAITYDTHNVALSFVSSALLNAVCLAAKPLNVVTAE